MQRSRRPLAASVFALCSLVLMVILVAYSPVLAGDAPAMPTPPKVSTFAPADDLVRQADLYIAGLEKSVADEEEYKDGKDKIAKDSNTLIVIALALGLHDEDSQYKAQSGAIMKAAGELAATKDFASAQKAVAALKDAAEGKQKVESELKWQKVASLPELMKQVPLVNTKLKRNLKPDKFQKKAKDTAGYTAVIAAIAQGSMADLSATKNPGQAQQWYKFSAAMRDDAGQLNAAIHKKDASGAAKAMKKLAQSCEDCHAVFHPGVKTDE
ncbi:MAG: hypothetical protein LLG00_01475 [Planctomycetaceae bacterium]|nr:hypothetical protein [Planctomycetaceae bacterium]